MTDAIEQEPVQEVAIEEHHDAMSVDNLDDEDLFGDFDAPLDGLTQARETVLSE